MCDAEPMAQTVCPLVSAEDRASHAGRCSLVLGRRVNDQQGGYVAGTHGSEEAANAEVAGSIGPDHAA
jgi:hypothetical protein